MATDAERPYGGQQLELFALATNWKRYVKAQIGEYLTGDVLEIGAGIGGTTLALHDGTARRWTENQDALERFDFAAVKARRA